MRADDHLALGPLEKEFAAIEASVPGFAGWYFDENGSAVARVKEMSRAPEALARVAELVKTRRSRDPQALARPWPKVVAEKANYSFNELAGYRELIHRDFPAGIRTVDVDEVRNVLSLGVENRKAQLNVRRIALALGIPANALAIEVIAPVQPRLTLTEYQRPLRGGNGFTNENGGNCTIALNGYLNSPTTIGFLSASHCSAQSWVIDTRPVFELGTMQMIGQEVEDAGPMAENDGFCVPEYPGTMENFECRYSDSAFFVYFNPATSGGATIHQMAADYLNSGWQNVVGNLPVTTDASSVTVGTAVHKVGITTGWTQGVITQTCVSTTDTDALTPNGKRMYLLCQDKSNLGVAGGDSGAALFVKYSNHLEWAGIVWGERAGNGQYWVYSSPAWGVRMDMPGFNY